MNYQPAKKPTFYFIGVTTGKSSIMRVFPAWAKHLGLGDVEIKGIDMKLHDEPERFPQLVIAPALVAAVWLHVFDAIEKLDAPALIAAHVDMLLRALKSSD